MRANEMFPVEVLAEIENDRIETTLRVELGLLVDQGLLHLGIDPATGEAVYWATARGVVELGMKPDSEVAV